MEYSSFLGIIYHPLNYHFKDWPKSLPKAIYQSRNRIGYIHITGQDSSTEYIIVPIRGVRLLVNDLDYCYYFDYFLSSQT